MDVEDHVVGHVEVEVAVVVVVEKDSAGAVVVPANSGGDVGKAAVPFVAVEDVGAVVGHVEVAVVVVVVVAHCATSTPAGVTDAGPGSGIDKGAVPAVGVQDIARAALVLVGGKGGAIDHVEIEVAVVVGVEKGGPSAVRFKDVLFFQVAKGVVEGDAGGFGLVGELGLCGQGPSQNLEDRKKQRTQVEAAGVIN